LSNRIKIILSKPNNLIEDNETKLKIGLHALNQKKNLRIQQFKNKQLKEVGF